MTKPKPKPDQNPTRHLHHLPSATPKPGQMLTPTNTLHSIKTLQKAGKAGKAKGEPSDNFSASAHRRRAQEARIAADPDKAPSPTPHRARHWWRPAPPACAPALKTTANTPAW